MGPRGARSRHQGRTVKFVLRGAGYHGARFIMSGTLKSLNAVAAPGLPRCNRARSLGLVLMLSYVAGCAEVAEPSYESAAQDHAHCAAFYITAALSPMNEASQLQLRQKAAMHKQNAVTLSDATAFENHSGAALEKIQAELKSSQSSIDAMVARNVKYCEDVAARAAGLLKRRTEELSPGVAGTRR